jgi:hypothetical protein
MRINVIRRIKKYIDDIGLLSAAAQLVVGPAIEVGTEDARQLVRLGLVRPFESDASAVPLESIGLLRDCLRAATLDANPWGQFGAAELALRSMVESVLTDAFGMDWLSSLRPRSGAVRRAWEGVEQRQAEDRRRFGRAASWLAYTYPGDLWTIISAHWTLFQPAFNRGDKGYWKQRCEGLAALRAPMAHNRVELLDDVHRLQVMSWSRDILLAWQEFEESIRSSIDLLGPQARGSVRAST